MKQPSVYLKMRVLGAVDTVEAVAIGFTIRSDVTGEANNIRI